MAASHAGAPAPPASRLLALERVAWPSVLRVVLGALFVSVFFENLNKSLYTASGYAGLIRGYERETVAPGAWKSVMGFIADHASLFAPLQAGFEGSLAVLLVLGIGTGAVALVSAGHLSALWLSELAPRRWVWELGSLVLIALVVGLAALPGLLDRRRPLRARLLGPPLFVRGGPAGRAAAALLGGLALAGAILAARTGGESHYQDVAWQSGVSFAVLLGLLGALDGRRDRDGAGEVAP